MVVKIVAGIIAVTLMIAFVLPPAFKAGMAGTLPLGTRLGAEREPMAPPVRGIVELAAAISTGSFSAGSWRGGVGRAWASVRGCETAAGVVGAAVAALVAGVAPGAAVLDAGTAGCSTAGAGVAAVAVDAGRCIQRMPK